MKKKILSILLIIFSCINLFCAGEKINVDVGLFVKEIAAALSDVAGYGQIWIKNTTPCEIWFTDDAGTDHQLGAGGSSIWTDGANGPYTMDNIGIGAASQASRAIYINAGSDTGIYCYSTANLGIHSIGTTNNTVQFDSQNQSATYAADHVSLNCSGRAASSAFDFMDCFANGSRIIQLTGDGNGLCDGSWTGGGADYAEYFDCIDKSVLNYGETVTIKNGVIVKAGIGDTVIGVIRPKNCVGFIGNNPLRDPDQFERNSFGKFNKNEKEEKIKKSEWIDKTFIKYGDRNSKILIGLLGQIPIKKGEIINSNWFFIKNIDENADLYLVK